MDSYSWSNLNFLPVFAAGNDGQGFTSGGTSSNGQSTVTSPGEPQALPAPQRLHADDELGHSTR